MGNPARSAHQPDPAWKSPTQPNPTFPRARLGPRFWARRAYGAGLGPEKNPGFMPMSSRAYRDRPGFFGLGPGLGPKTRPNGRAGQGSGLSFVPRAFLGPARPEFWPGIFHTHISQHVFFNTRWLCHPMLSPLNACLVIYVNTMLSSFLYQDSINEAC